MEPSGNYKSKILKKKERRRKLQNENWRKRRNLCDGNKFVKYFYLFSSFRTVRGPWEVKKAELDSDFGPNK